MQSEQILLPIYSTKRESLCTLLGLAQTKARELVEMPGFPKPVYLFSRNPKWIREEVIEWLKTQRTKPAGNSNDIDRDETS